MTSDKMREEYKSQMENIKLEKSSRERILSNIRLADLSTAQTTKNHAGLTRIFLPVFVAAIVCVFGVSMILKTSEKSSDTATPNTEISQDEIASEEIPEAAQEEVFEEAQMMEENEALEEAEEIETESAASYVHELTYIPFKQKDVAIACGELYSITIYSGKTDEEKISLYEAEDFSAYDEFGLDSKNFTKNIDEFNAVLYGDEDGIFKYAKVDSDAAILVVYDAGATEDEWTKILSGMT